MENINENKLAEFLSEHKRNCENFNENGEYDPNPYWLAEEIVKLFSKSDVSSSDTITLTKEELKTFVDDDEQGIGSW